MTMPDHGAYPQIQEEIEEHTIPVEVHVVNLPSEHINITASYVTIPVPVTPANFTAQLCGQDRHRHCVKIWADAKVLIGQRDEVLQGKGATVLANNAPVELYNKQEIWVATTGVAANVSVIIERKV